MREDTRATRRSWFVRAAFASLRYAAALVVALVLVEVALRLVGSGIPPRGPNNNLPLRVRIPAVQAPGLGDGLRPRSSGKVLYPGFGSEPDRWVTYRINSDGFRDRMYARKKPPGTLRIALLGDSVTYGTGVAHEDTLPEQLEGELAKLVPGLTVEVMNCGVYAHNTGQQIAWFEYAVLDFAPDLVLVVSTVPDASGTGIEAPVRHSSWEERWIRRLGLTSGVWEPEETQTRAQRMMMTARRHSRIVDHLSHHAYGAMRNRVAERNYHQDWAAGSPGRKYVERALRRACALSVEHDFQLGVAMYPTLTSLNETYPYASVAKALREICEVLEIPFHDIFEALAGQRATSLHAHAHDYHPNAEANGLVAAWLAPRLAKVIQ